MKVTVLKRLIVDKPDEIVGIYESSMDARLAELEYLKNPPPMNAEQMRWGGALYTEETFEVIPKKERSFEEILAELDKHS